MVRKFGLTKLLFLVLLITTAHSQERNPFYIGHSLVNHDMPIMVNALAIDAGMTTHFDKQVINGSPLSYNYDNPANAQGTPYTDAFPAGNFNTLIITEAVPLQNHLTWSNTYSYANSFYNYAKNNNNSVPIRFYIYETWHCINSGIPLPDLPSGCNYDNSANSNTLWHPRLLADFPLWSGIVDSVRLENPNDDEIWMVPAGQAFYNLQNEISAGNLPGITSYTDLFVDDIHLSNAGNYFIACVMYATIYRTSPEGLTTMINNQWGGLFPDMPSSAQAQIMQEVAWNTVVNLPGWTGVVDGGIDLNNGLIAYYPFNSNANDESGNDNHGTLSGPLLTTDRFATLDQAFTFDGADDNININAISPEVNQVTATSLSCWFKTDNSPPNDGDNLLFSGRTSTNTSADGNTFRIGTSSNGGIFLSSQLSQNNVIGSEYNDDLIHHLVLTHSPTGIAKIFIDNNLVDSLNVGIVNWPNFTDFKISGIVDNAVLSACFDGTLDDLRIYDRVISMDEIDELYNEGCIREQVIENQTISSNLTLYARDQIELNNIVLNGPVELYLKSPSITINNNCVFNPGSSLRIVNEDGCLINK